jgi:hypothetical protein
MAHEQFGARAIHRKLCHGICNILALAHTPPGSVSMERRPFLGIHSTEQLVRISTWPHNLGFGPLEKRAEKLTLGDILQDEKYKGKVLVYTWDFGWNWNHVIVVKGQVPHDEAVVCRYGKGKPPGEVDFGPFTFDKEDKGKVNKELKKWAETWKQAADEGYESPDGSEYGGDEGQDAQAEEAEEEAPARRSSADEASENKQSEQGPAIASTETPGRTAQVDAVKEPHVS